MGLADLIAMQEQADLAGMPLGNGMNMAGMANRQRNNDRGGNPVQRTARQSPFVASDPFEDQTNDMNAAMLANHFQAQRDSVRTANDIIGDEMDRRVAISREQRRMALELEKERMRQETERMKVEALLKRLESGSSPRASGPGFVIY